MDVTEICPVQGVTKRPVQGATRRPVQGATRFPFSFMEMWFIDS